MGLIKRSDSKNWYYQFRLDGKTYVGSTRTTSKAKAAKVEQKRRNEIHAQVMMGEHETITLGEAIRQHMESRKKYASWQNTQAGCHRLMGFKLNPHTGKKIKLYGLDPTTKLHKITTANVERLVAKRYEEKYAPQTIKHEMSNLRQTIKMMKKLGYKTNPKLEIPIPKVSRTRVRYLTSEEESMLLHELRNSKKSDNYDFGLLLLDTGMRYMEAATIPWSAVDMDSKTITVYRHKVKNESNLAMTDRVFKMMEQRHKLKGKDRYVFMSNDGKTHRKYTKNGISNAFERAGLNDPQIVKEKGSRATAHTLRHTFASKLAQNGMSLYEIGKLLGHADVQSTAIYAHLCPNTASAKAVEILNS